MPFSERLLEHVSACFTGLWVQSHEHDDALGEIALLCREHDWRLATWDTEQGFRVPGVEAPAETDAADPLAAIRSLAAMNNPGGTTLLVLPNFHRFLHSGEIVQALSHQITAGKQNRTFIVILSPIVDIPAELEKLIVVLEHDLPGRDQIDQIARSIATEEGELPEGDALVSVLDAAAGLTRYEAEGAFSLSLVRHGSLRPEVLWELKSQMLKKSGLLGLHRGGERFDDLGGLDALKAFCLRSMRRQGSRDPLRKPRGVMLLGVPGTGKSAVCKALGAETGRPTLILDVGALMGSLVGQTEQNVRTALRIAEAMAPAVLMIDEIDKALSGVASGGNGDSGVSARLFGTLLTWLNDRTSDVYVVCTCNNISKLPPEFTRAERFDGVWFLDLPGLRQKQTIWRMYLEAFGLEADQALPDDADWTGAEIRACCRLAALLDVPVAAAAQNIVPVAHTARESVEQLRAWAAGRCLDADRGGMYRHGPKNRGSRPGRRIQRVDPLNN